MRKCDLASITFFFKIVVIEIGISIGFLIMLQNLVLMYAEEHHLRLTQQIKNCMVDKALLCLKAK